MMAEVVKDRPAHGIDIVARIDDRRVGYARRFPGPLYLYRYRRRLSRTRLRLPRGRSRPLEPAADCSLPAPFFQAGSAARPFVGERSETKSQLEQTARGPHGDAGFPCRPIPTRKPATFLQLLTPRIDRAAAAANE